MHLLPGDACGHGGMGGLRCPEPQQGASPKGRVGGIAGTQPLPEPTGLQGAGTVT